MEEADVVKRDSGMYVLLVRDPVTENWTLHTVDSARNLKEVLKGMGGLKDKPYRLFAGAKERRIEERVVIDYTF